ncbi:MAG: class I SAM-dependent methyltransferase [Sphingobium sp.]
MRPAVSFRKKASPVSMHNIADNLKFFRQFLRSPKMVGSIYPTSGVVIDHLLGQVDWSATTIFVEYGPGVGTFTRPILERLRPDGRLIAIDTCRDFIDHLEQEIADPRLIPVHGSAADIETILRDHTAGKQADHVISGLPFSTLPQGVGQEIAAATARALSPEGSFLIYQYSRFVLPLLRPHFAALGYRRLWRNIPPCFVFTARKGPSGQAIPGNSAAA